jgi:hypothetical protein
VRFLGRPGGLLFRRDRRRFRVAPGLHGGLQDFPAHLIFGQSLGVPGVESLDGEAAADQLVVAHAAAFQGLVRQQDQQRVREVETASVKTESCTATCSSPSSSRQ